MVFQIEKGAEPIPGYRLIRVLGRGGFGEVWEAEAPGGIRKAIKFVFGDMHSMSTAAPGAEQELRSLTRVKGVRHPYLLSLERVDLVEGHLVIVTELADKDLLLHFHDYRKQGLPGIPREELLRFMEETAEVLDLMNQTHDLQHMDIKPQNLCLLHNHVKVADFGLVKDLSGVLTSMTGGMTPKYAAPETFEGVVSRYSDQYSLAVVYQELLTGQAPFVASSVHQMMQLQMAGHPNLQPLPLPDRAIVGRALTKDFNQRYPSCVAFVRALRQVEKPETGAVPVVPPPAALSVRSATPTVPRSQLDHPTARVSAPVAPVTEMTSDGVLAPALVVGLGRFGLEVLRQLRKLLFARTVGPARLPQLELLGIDTDPETVAEALRGSPDEALDRDDVLLARLSRISHYLRPPPPLPSPESWIPQRVLSRIPRSLLTGGSRALGRLALVDNYRGIINRLRRALDRITAPEALPRASRESGLGWRSNWPRIYVVANLAGGTGSGMFIDLAYLMRSVLIDRGYGRSEINALVHLPPAPARGRGVSLQAESVLHQGNIHAALAEMHHFAAEPFHAQYETTSPPLQRLGPPFSRTVLLTEDAEESIAQAPAVAGGEYLYLELMTAVGREAEKARLFEPATLVAAPNALLFQASGWTMVASPARQLFRDGLRRLGQDLLERWLVQKSLALRTQIRSEIQGQLHEQGLNPQSILAELRQECTSTLGKTPEVLIAGWTEPVAETVARATPDPWIMKKTLDQVEQLLGRAQEESLQSGPISTAIGQAAERVGRHCWQKLVDLVGHYLERPGFRHAGMVEAATQALALVEKDLKLQETQVTEQENRLRQMAESLHRGLDTIDRGPDMRKPRERAAPPVPLADLARTLISYPTLCWQYLLLVRLRGIYISLRGALSDQVRAIHDCKEDLTALRASLDDLRAPVAASGVPAKGPSGKGPSPEEGLDRLVRSLNADDWLRLDEAIQKAVQGERHQLGSVATALTSQTGQRKLREIIVEEAGTFLGQRLPMLKDPLELFLTQHPDEQALTAALRCSFDAAAPLLGGAPVGHHPREFSLVLAPASAGGERILEAVRPLLPPAGAGSTARQDAVIFYRECPGLTMPELVQRDVVDLQALGSSQEHHTRFDIAWRPVSDAVFMPLPGGEGSSLGAGPEGGVDS